MPRYLIEASLDLPSKGTDEAINQFADILNRITVGGLGLSFTINKIELAEPVILQED